MSQMQSPNSKEELEQNIEQPISSQEESYLSKGMEKDREKKAGLISLNPDSQSLAPTDHVQLVGFIKQMIAAKAIPKHLKTVADVLSAWNYAAQLKLPPQPSLRNIAIIEGTPSLFGDLPLALVQNHDEFVFIEEYCVDKDYKRICLEEKNLDGEVWGGVCMLQRKGMAKPQTFAFTKSDAERAGLLGRNNPWKTYPQVMLVRRARSIAIKSLFADAITGASIAEESGYAPDLVDVTPNTKSNLLNETYGQKNEVQ